GKYELDTTCPDARKSQSALCLVGEMDGAEQTAADESAAHEQWLSDDEFLRVGDSEDLVDLAANTPQHVPARQSRPRLVALGVEQVALGSRHFQLDDLRVRLGEQYGQSPDCRVKCVRQERQQQLAIARLDHRRLEGDIRLRVTRMHAQDVTLRLHGAAQ